MEKHYLFGLPTFFLDNQFSLINFIWSRNLICHYLFVIFKSKYVLIFSASFDCRTPGTVLAKDFRKEVKKSWLYKKTMEKHYLFGLPTFFLDNQFSFTNFIWSPNFFCHYLFVVIKSNYLKCFL